MSLVCINDLDIGISGEISKFADDAKIASKVQGAKDNYRSHRARTVAWAPRCEMEFNSQKCKVKHVHVHVLRNFHYEMEGVWLKAVENENDLGVVIDKTMKFPKQCF